MREAACSLAILLAVLLSLPALGQDAPLESAVKATYLVKLGAFIEWPASAFASPAAPLRLCVIGGQPFGPLLDEAARGQSAAEHPIEIHRAATGAGGAGCHILFAAVPPGQVGDVLQAVRGRPVLTVTDLGPASGPKGIVNFVTRDYRVRFEIDDRAAAENGLGISSKLLTLAVNVRPRG